MNLEIIHNEEEKRFETVVDGVTAYISYVNYNKGIELTHTIVPKEIGGRGVAAALVEHALQYAINKGVMVKPICSYVKVYIERHKEQYSSIADDTQSLN